jgi:cyclopropane fatty-acyl-phospholipid synthase-like methyltransferase
MVKKKNNSYVLHSQIDLPYLETNEIFIKDIFLILKQKFGLKKKSHQRFIDLGCGDGRVVIHATLYYDIKSTGVEINQNLLEEANSRLRLLKTSNRYNRKQLKKIKILHEDLFQQNLYKYDFVYIFSLPSMQKFLKHTFNTIQKNAIIISYKYPLKDFNSMLILEEKIELESEHQIPIRTFFYRKI